MVFPLVRQFGSSHAGALFVPGGTLGAHTQVRRTNVPTVVVVRVGTYVFRVVLCVVVSRGRDRLAQIGGWTGHLSPSQTRANVRSSSAVYEAACQSDAFVHEGCIKGKGRCVRYCLDAAAYDARPYLDPKAVAGEADAQ